MWRGLLVVVLSLLGAVGPAEAARTVARVDGFELRARQHDGRLCMVLRRDGRYQGARCGRIPRSPQRPLRILPDAGFRTDAADRLVTLACVGVANGRGFGGACDGGAEHAYALIAACAGRDLFGAIVAPGVTGVRLTLGSGVEATLPATELPHAFGGRRVAAAPVPAGEAVRAAAALDATGAVAARAAIGTPPGGRPCPGEDHGHDSATGVLVPAAPPPGAVTVASAGGESLFAADQGERLCTGLGALPARVCPAAAGGLRPPAAASPGRHRRGGGE